MRRLHPAVPPWKRALLLVRKAVLTLLKVLLLLLLVVLPIPIVSRRFNIGPPARRNPPAEVDRKR